MRVLLDTHALIWWLAGDERHLSADARRVISDSITEVFVSAATAWEIATKVRIGKLPGVAPLAGRLLDVIAEQGFRELSISVADGERAGLLPGPHRDPFDRMLIAQAQTHGLPLISNESLFDGYGINRIW